MDIYSPLVGPTIPLSERQAHRPKDWAAAAGGLPRTVIRGKSPLKGQAEGATCPGRAFTDFLNVTYPVGGAEELVSQPQSGVVTEPDPAAAARAIAGLMALSSSQRDWLAERCRATAAAHSAAAMAEDTIAVYRRALKRSAGNGGGAADRNDASPAG